MKSDPTNVAYKHGVDNLRDPSPMEDSDADHHHRQSQQKRPQHEQQANPLDSLGRMTAPHNRTNSHAPPTCYRSMPPREYALGNEVRRSDNNASFVPTLLPSSTLRNSAAGGSQYSWSSRGSGSGYSPGGGSWRAGEAGRGSGGGGGLSNTSITMNAEQSSLGDGGSKENIQVGPDNNDDHEHVEQETPNEESQKRYHQQRQHDEEAQDKTAMRRISEEDMTMSSGLSSLVKRNPGTYEESEEDVLCFERSIGSNSHLLHYQPAAHNTHSTALLSSPNPGVSPYESAMEEDTLDAERGCKIEETSMVQASLKSTEDDEQDDETNDVQPPFSRQSLSLQQKMQEEQQQNMVLTMPQDQYSGTSFQLNLETTAPLAITHIKSPASVSTMDSESFHPELAATARFGRLLQQCRELTETCENSTVDGSEKMGSSNRSFNDERKVAQHHTAGMAQFREAPAVGLQTFEPRKLFSNPIAMRTEIQTTGRVYNASDITMDPFLKSSEFLSSVDESTRAHRHKLDFSTKSTVSDLSLGVDRMYNDARTGMDYTDLKRPPLTSSISELSYGDSYRDGAVGGLSTRPNQKPNNIHAKKENGVNQPEKPNYMSYLPNGTKDVRGDRRSWLSYTDDEATPRNGAQNKGTIQSLQVPIADARPDGSGFKKTTANTMPRSTQSSYYSTDFSDEGSGGLLVGFGKRRKSCSSDSSDSSSTDYSSSTGSSSSNGSTGSSSSSSSSTGSSSSSSECDEDESEPSMPAIARGGLRLTHQQDDDVSALSFGGASALVVSASRVAPLANTKLLPEENSRSHISETSSAPTHSLEKSREAKKELSPESIQSNRSSKLSESELHAGVTTQRKNPLSGAETLTEDMNIGPITMSRRSTLADSWSVVDQMPQLEEESSEAASISPSIHRKSSSTMESMTTPGSKNNNRSVASKVSPKNPPRQGSVSDYTEVLAESVGMVSASNSEVFRSSPASFGSNRDRYTHTKAISATNYSETSPKPAIESRSSRSSSTSLGSKRDKHATTKKESATNNASYASSLKSATVSRSSRCSSGSFVPGRDSRTKIETKAASNSESSQKFATASLTSRSSRSNSASFGSKLSSALSQVGEPTNIPATETPDTQPAGQAFGASTSQGDRPSPRPPSEKSMLEVSSVEFPSPEDNAMFRQRDDLSSITNREKSNAPEHFHLKRVAEEPPELQSYGDTEQYFTSQSIPNFPTENFHPSEYLLNDGVRHDDNRSINSSVSSVVSHARASFHSRSKGMIVTGSSSVISALSDQSKADTKPRGSFRKSASDMITERLSSKVDVGSRSREPNQINVDKTSPPALFDWRSGRREQLDLSANSGKGKSQHSIKAPVEKTLLPCDDFGSVGTKQLDLSAKSGTDIPSDGYLYEGFPSQKTNVLTALIRSNRDETTRFHSARESTEETDARKPWKTTIRKAFVGDGSSSVQSDGILPAEDYSIDVMRNSQSIDDDSALSEVLDSKAALISMGLYSNDSKIDEDAPKDIEDTDRIAAVLLQERHDPVYPEHLSASSTTSSITEWDFSGQIKARPSDQVEDLQSNSRQSMSSHSQGFAPSRGGDQSTSVTYATAHDQTASVTNTSGTSDPPSNEQEQNEKKDSLTAQSKRENARKSMAHAANEMSSKLEKSLLSRSQRQAQNDFESRSYEDLSSASEEDAVLAYLRQRKNAAEPEYVSQQQFHGFNSIVNIAPDRKGVSSESCKSDSEDRTNSFLNAFLKQKAIMNPKGHQEEKLDESTDAGGSESEYLYAVIRPTFSDPDIEDVPLSNGSDDESRSLSSVSHDKADADSESTRSSKDERDEEETAWYHKRAFRKSKMWIPLCFAFLVVIIVVVAIATTGSKQTESTPTAQPTVPEVVPPVSSSPTSKPSRVTSPSSWYQVGGDIMGGPGDELGFSISTSKQGNRFIVGSRRNGKDDMRNRGSASIYEFNARERSYIVLTTIYGEQAGDQCGYSVSMAEDGKRVAIGSLGSDKNGNNSGQVRVFEENILTKEWILVYEFIGETEGSLFGTSVSLSQDGSKVAVGAPYYGNDGTTRLGRAYLYREIKESVWNPIGEPISGELSDDLFGWSVSWSPDAKLLAIGAPGKEDTSSSGYVKIFSYESDQWNLYGRLIFNDVPGDRFGFSIFLAGTSTKYRVAIGAPGTTNERGESSGYACIFEYDSDGWLPVGNGISGGWGEHLGYAVAFTPDAERMIVGVPNKLSNGLPSGQLKIFDVRDGSLVSTGEIHGNEGEDFGISVAISYDGRIVYGGATAGNLVRVFEKQL